ncbi:hypothetical protein TNCV_3160141 [Trichonephila clavipes]|nr:hypothetical protein TNCV_3160141 [Trichonephila clavipes]
MGQILLLTFWIYRRALAKGEKPAPHKFNIGTPINPDYLTKIVPIYQRLASDSLLKRCATCLTQNSNQSLHSVIWTVAVDSEESKRLKQLFEEPDLYSIENPYSLNNKIKASVKIKCEEKSDQGNSKSLDFNIKTLEEIKNEKKKKEGNI